MYLYPKNKHLHIMYNFYFALYKNTPVLGTGNSCITQLYIGTINWLRWLTFELKNVV